MTIRHRDSRAHECEALVIHCIDFRFHEAIREFVRQTLGLASYDVLTIPGAVKHLTAAGSPERQAGFVEDIEISLELHDQKQIILVNHADCGAYGGAQAFGSPGEEAEVHQRALSEAASFLRARYPCIGVRRMYAELNSGTVSVALVS